MSLRKKVFTITADSLAQPINNPERMSHGYTDGSIPPSTRTRTANLQTVVVDVSAAFSKDVDVTISELDDVSAYTYSAAGVVHAAGTDYALGRQLFYVDLRSPSPANGVYPAGDKYEFDARRPVVSTYGAVPATDQFSSFEQIRSDQLRCEVYKMAPGDVVTVTVYYETAGDYRF